MQIVVDNLLTSYAIQGHGRTVLLLHGWGDTAAGLVALQVPLAMNFQVIALDLPGFGQTQIPPMAWGLREYSDFVAHFLTKLNVDPLYAIVGHSNGGAIAITGIAHDLLQAERLILLASAGVRDVQNNRRRTIQALTKIGKAATFFLPAAIKRTLRRQVYKSVGSDLLLAPHMEETFKRTVRTDVQNDARHLRLPTLLIYGEQDKATPVVFGQRLHELIKGSALITVPNAGHFLHIDAPAKTAAAIEGFLA